MFFFWGGEGGGWVWGGGVRLGVGLVGGQRDVKEEFGLGGGFRVDVNEELKFLGKFIKKIRGGGGGGGGGGGNAQCWG